MDWMTKIASILLIIGGLNWGLIGISSFDLVAFLFGNMTLISRVIYTVVGLSAIWELLSYFYPSGEASK